MTRLAWWLIQLAWFPGLLLLGVVLAIATMAGCMTSSGGGTGPHEVGVWQRCVVTQGCESTQLEEEERTVCGVSAQEVTDQLSDLCAEETDDCAQPHCEARCVELGAPCLR